MSRALSASASGGNGRAARLQSLLFARGRHHLRRRFARSQAEVRDAHLSAAVGHDVGRLEVAVQHAAFVRGGQTRTDAARW